MALWCFQVVVLLVLKMVVGGVMMLPLPGLLLGLLMGLLLLGQPVMLKHRPQADGAAGLQVLVPMMVLLLGQLEVVLMLGPLVPVVGPLESLPGPMVVLLPLGLHPG